MPFRGVSATKAPQNVVVVETEDHVAGVVRAAVVGKGVVRIAAWIPAAQRMVVPEVVMVATLRSNQGEVGDVQ